MAQRIRHRATVGDAARSRGMAITTGCRTIQPRRRSTKNRPALTRQTLGHSNRSAADHAYPEAADRFVRRPCGKRTSLSYTRARPWLPAAQSNVMRFEDEVAIVIERYDRLLVGNDIIRVHQEDVAKHSAFYRQKNIRMRAAERDIVELLRTSSTDRAADVRTFVEAIGFNWLIAGTDAHAKNYSLLLAGDPIRLAPLYDVASILPYDQFDLHKVKLAMKVGGEYKLNQIGLRQWQKFGRDLRVDDRRACREARPRWPSVFRTR